MSKFIADQISKSSPRVLLIGDLMLDKYIFGSVERISPEAPVPIVSLVSEKQMLGGCGNVLRNLNNLGVKTSIISAIGDDPTGKSILEKLQEKNILTSKILIMNKKRSTKKTRIIADRQQIARVDWDMEGFNESDYNSILDFITEDIKLFDGIIISDYLKGICSSKVLKRTIDTARKNLIPVFIDPKGDDWDKYHFANLITPNKKEAELVIGSRLNSNKDFEFAGRKICKDYSIDACLITRGSDGMSYISTNDVLHLKSNAKEIFDVSGAGDTVIAAISTGLMIDLGIEQSVDFANKAAGIVVSHIGTSAITIEEIKEI